MLTDRMPTDELTGPEPSPTLRRVGGGLIIASTVVMLAGFSLEVSPMHGDSADSIQQLFVGAPFDRVVAGGYIEALSFLILLPALVLVARTYGRTSEAARWAAVTGLGAGIVNVASSLAVGLPAGAAALSGAKHGADAATLLTVVEIRNYAFFLTVCVLGAHAIAVGLSALLDKRHVVWVGYGGVVGGVATIAAVGMGMQNLGSMVWLVWWVGLGVVLLRGAPTRSGSNA